MQEVHWNSTENNFFCIISCPVSSFPLSLTYAINFPLFFHNFPFPSDPIIILLPPSSFTLYHLYLYLLPSKYVITEEQGKKAVLHITSFQCFTWGPLQFKQNAWKETVVYTIQIKNNNNIILHIYNTLISITEWWSYLNETMALYQNCEQPNSQCIQSCWGDFIMLLMLKCFV